MGKVTVVGSYIVALVMDVDRIPLEGETVLGRNYHITHGGKGSNMAACSARLGVDATFMGKIGRDSFGKGFISLLKEEGVDHPRLAREDQGDRRRRRRGSSCRGRLEDDRRAAHSSRKRRDRTAAEDGG